MRRGIVPVDKPGRTSGLGAGAGRRASGQASMRAGGQAGGRAGGQAGSRAVGQAVGWAKPWALGCMARHAVERAETRRLNMRHSTDLMGVVLRNITWLSWGALFPLKSSLRMLANAC